MNLCKRLVKIVIATSIFVSICMLLEPKMFIVKRVALQAPNDKLKGLKLVHFTDVHLGDYYNIEQLSSVVDTINEIKPDLVFYTGDLLDSKYTKVIEVDKISEVLSSIETTYGKFAVRGNHDTRKNTEEYRLIMNNAMFTLLENESKILNIEGVEFAVSGVDDYISGDRDFLKTFKDLDESIFKLVLCHEGDLVDCFTRTKDVGADYVFSGHTHGGQINLPFVENTWLPFLGEKYVKGEYVINNRTTLHVSSGLGSTGVPLRFRNKPEIILFTFE